MDPFLMMALLIVAAIIAVPVLIFLRLAALNRAVCQLQNEIDALKRRRPAESPATPSELAQEPSPPPEKPKAPTPPVPAPTPAPAFAPAPVPTVAAPPDETPAPRPLAWSPDWESLLGANWLSKLGIVALAVAAAFFLKYAFDVGWIGPTARVAVGLLAAGALIGIGQWFLPLDRYRAYAQVLMSGGIVIFFLSIYAAYNYYHLIGFGVAFAALALAALAASALAAANDTESVALLCLLGAFAAPVLVHEQGVGPTDLPRLYAYLTALNVWSGLLARYRSWFSVTVLALGATWLIFFGSAPGRQPNFLLLEAFAVAFLVFACWGGVSALGGREEAGSTLGSAPVAVILVACVAFAAASAQILAGSCFFGLPSLVLPGIFLAALLIGLSVALPALPEYDGETRQLLSYHSAAALLLLVGLAIASGPRVP
ncbi:MAG: DUF2339 domain-containing protein, partial [Armatimonadetes bacterium]|nr:DUF2339 domain-containing protein [Armatimonadota bacterium]